VVAAALSACIAFLEKKALESTHELLLFEVRVVDIIIIFLVMTACASGLIWRKPTSCSAINGRLRRSIATGFPAYCGKSGDRAGPEAIVVNYDCGGDCIDRRAVGVDEVGATSQCARSVFLSQFILFLAFDSALLASAEWLLPTTCRIWSSRS